MRLSCPGCQTEYEVPDAALAGRVRTLRCAHCSRQWEYGPLPAAPAAAEAATLVSPAPMAAWPNTSQKPAYETVKPAEALATNVPAYEPAEPPTRDSWPPPPGPSAAVAPYQPTPALQPITEPAAITTASERALMDRALAQSDLAESYPAETLPAEPAYLPETKTQPASGNEERFAALVRTSRDESDAEIQPPRRKSSATLITILLVIGICAGIWFARFHIMQAWPPSTRLFSAINNAIAAFTTAPHH